VNNLCCPERAYSHINRNDHNHYGKHNVSARSVIAFSNRKERALSFGVSEGARSPLGLRFPKGIRSHLVAMVVGSHHHENGGGYDERRRRSPLITTVLTRLVQLVIAL